MVSVTGRRADLCRGFLEESDEVIPVLCLLQTSKGHLGARDVLFRVLEVVEQCVLIPVYTFLFVGIGVGKARHLPALPAEETVQLRANLVLLVRAERVALCAAGLEETFALFEIAF